MFFWPERFDLCFQARLKHDPVRLRQKHGFPGLLAGLGQESHLGHTQLRQRVHRSGMLHDSGAIVSDQAV